MALTDNLIGFWELEEASGNRVDATANALTLSQFNTPGNTTGKVGNATQFTAASSQYLYRASEAALQAGDIDFSFQAWVWFGSRSVNHCLVTKDVDSPASSRDYTLDFDATFNYFRFYINGGAGGLIVTFGSGLADSTWYHVCAGHSASADELWGVVNAGTPATQATGGAVPQTSSAQFRIGARAYSGFENYHEGLLDQVGFWKRDIRADVATLYNSGAGLSYAAMGSGGKGIPPGLFRTNQPRWFARRKVA